MKDAAIPEVARPETVLVLRTCKADMTGFAGFKWPESGPVEAPAEWWGEPGKQPTDLLLGFSNHGCGAGLHGWLWGAGDWSLKVTSPGARWIVIEVEKALIVDLGGKVKFPRGVVRGVFGNWAAAMKMIRAEYPKEIGTIASGDYGHAAASGDYGHAAASGNSGHAAASGNSGHAAASGNSGHAAASGYSGHAAASGDYGHAAASGNYGHAAASGYYGHAAASGYYGHAAASGDYGHAAASGKEGVAFAGIEGRAKAGADGAIVCLYRDAGRKRVLVGYVGEDGIEAGQWYAVSVKKSGAQFVKAEGCEKCDAEAGK